MPLIDLHCLPAGQEFQSDLLIVGGGIAGLVLADWPAPFRLSHRKRQHMSPVGTVNTLGAMAMADGEMVV